MNAILPTDATLAPGEPWRPVRIPGSKSVTNRALLLAAMAPGPSHLQGGLEAEDTQWMRRSLQGLGIRVEEDPGGWTVHGGAPPIPQGPLWLGASGTTLRFLLPWLALALAGPVHLAGEPRLFERPLEPLLAPLLGLGARWEPCGDGAWLHPVAVRPERLDLEVDARLSSQFLTGLALAAATLPGTSVLRWRSVASPSYLALTAHWLAQFACPATLESDRWILPGGRLQPRSLRLPGDWSGAAAFLAGAAATGRRLTVGPLDPEDPQGDRALLAILERAGVPLAWTGPQEVTVAGPLCQGLDADLTDCPDLGPVLAALAALAPRASELRGLHTLPLKECDRLAASADLVRWLGGDPTVIGDHTLRVVPGQPGATRPPYDPRRDHRMAFAAAVGALRWGGELRDPDCVAKTFPAFWETWRSMLGC